MHENVSQGITFFFRNAAECGLNKWECGWNYMEIVSGIIRVTTPSKLTANENL